MDTLGAPAPLDAAGRGLLPRDEPRAEASPPAAELAHGPVRPLEAVLREQGFLLPLAAFLVGVCLLRHALRIQQQGRRVGELWPGRILLDDRRAWLSEGGPRPAASAAFPYSPPECRAGGPPTHRSEQYAMGVVLLECFTGTLAGAPPEPGRGRPTWGAGPVVRVQDCLPWFPPDLDRVLARMMRPDPTERYASTLEAYGSFRAALRAYLALPVPGVRRLRSAAGWARLACGREGPGGGGFSEHLQVGRTGADILLAHPAPLP